VRVVENENSGETVVVVDSSEYDTTKAVGKYTPGPELMATMSDGARIPLGKCCEKALPQGQERPNNYYYMPNHNEYVVKEPKRCQVRYLVKYKETE